MTETEKPTGPYRVGPSGRSIQIYGANGELRGGFAVSPVDISTWCARLNAAYAAGAAALTAERDQARLELEAERDKANAEVVASWSVIERLNAERYTALVASAATERQLREQLAEAQEQNEKLKRSAMERSAKGAA